MLSQRVIHYIGQTAPQHQQQAAHFIFSLPLGWSKQLPVCARQFGFGTTLPPFQVAIVANAILYITSSHIQNPSWAVKRTALKLLQIHQLIIHNQQQSLF